MTVIVVNGAKREVKSEAGTPLLYVLRNELGVNGPQFGCGMAQCGACSVLVGDAEVRACVTPLAAVEGQEVTTLEGLPGRWARRTGRTQWAGIASRRRSLSGP